MMSNNPNINVLLNDNVNLTTRPDIYRLIYNSNPTAMFITDMNGNFIDTNSAFQRLIENDNDYLVGNNLIKLMPKAEFTKLNNNLNQIKNSNNHVSFNTILQKNNQTHIPVEMTLTKLENNECEKSLVCTVIEITNKIFDENYSRKNEIRLNSLMNLAQMSEQSYQTIMDYGLEEGIKLTQSKIGYIYYYSEETELFTLYSWSKTAMTECTIVEKQTVYELNKTGIWGEAVRQRKTIIVNEFLAENPLKKGYPEGHVQLVRFMTIPVFRNGKIVAVIGMGNKESDYNNLDITQLTLFINSLWNIVEKKRAEEEKEKTQSLLWSIINSSPFGANTYQINSENDLILISTNESAKKILGFDLNSQIGKKIEQIFPGFRNTNYLDALKKLAVQGGQYINNNLKYADEGIDGLFEIQAFGTGKNLITIFFKEITEQRRAEEALRESEEKFRNLVEFAEFGIILHDKNYKKTYFNKAFSRITGFSDNELEGMTAIDLMGQNKKEEFEKIFNNLIEKGHSTFELEIEKKSGKKVYINNKSKVLKDINGNISGFLTVIDDITFERKSAKDLEQYAKDLAEMVSNRDKLFSIISHDLRSPFNGIMGLSKLIDETLDEIEPDELKNLIHVLSQTSAKVYNLLETLLEWSRLQQGKIAYNPRTENLKEIIGIAIDLMKQNLREKEISLTNEIDADLICRMDVDMISTVIRNLIANSIKFTFHGGEINIRSERKENNWIAVSVTDNGIGMDESTRSHLFSPELNKSLPGTDGEHGSGLGLMLSKEFIAMHGGVICVESEPGKGSTFTFTIPAAEAF